MSCLVAFGFLLDAACKCFGDVYIGLVGNAEKYPKDVRDFFFNVVFLSFLKRLVAVFACHNSCQLADFFGQYGHIGELAEVTYSVFFYPGVHFLLCFF